MHISAQLKTVLTLGLVAICLSGCANRDPLSMIPAGLRATLQSEDRAAQPKRPVSVAGMLAKARGATEVPEAAPSAPPSVAPVPAPVPASVPAPVAEPVETQAAPAPRPETLLRFAPASPKLSSVEMLKLTLAAHKLAAQPGPVRILMGPGEGTLSPAQTMALVMQRGASVKAALPKDLVARAELHYSPSLSPDTAVLRPSAPDSELQ
jgi:hypothetical protein